jgi:urease accessory protein
VAQGRALLGVWERAFCGEAWGGDKDGVAEVLDSFRARLRASPSLPDMPSAHFPPLWGAISRAMSLSLPQAAHLFLFNHIKALLSAAVRASVMGPYQAHAVLAAEWVQVAVWEALGEVWEVEVEDAGQVVPVLDLYQGRHELLYSRIFNS